MTAVSRTRARLPRLALPKLIAVTLLLKLARYCLWLVRVTDRYDGALMRMSRRIIESAERIAISDEWRRRVRS